jgi:hypothetical protein
MPLRDHVDADGLVHGPIAPPLAKVNDAFTAMKQGAHVKSMAIVSDKNPLYASFGGIHHIYANPWSRLPEAVQTFFIAETSQLVCQMPTAAHRRARLPRLPTWRDGHLGHLGILGGQSPTTRRGSGFLPATEQQRHPPRLTALSRVLSPGGAGSRPPPPEESRASNSRRAEAPGRLSGQGRTQ